MLPPVVDVRAEEIDCHVAAGRNERAFSRRTRPLCHLQKNTLRKHGGQARRLNNVLLRTLPPQGALRLLGKFHTLEQTAAGLMLRL
jgi:hypothetical protein